MSLPQESQPDFFEILACPRAYTTVAFLLLSLGTGILSFTFVTVGLSLSLGLAILIIGFPLALAFLAGTRAMALGELWLLRTLVVDPPLETPRMLPAGNGWLGRLKTLVTDPHTWTGLLYFLLKLPMGILGFTLMVVSLSLGVSLLAVPLAYMLQARGSLDLECSGLAQFGAHPASGVVLCLLLGVLFLPLSLHLAMALGRFQGWLARHLLIHA